MGVYNMGNNDRVRRIKHFLLFAPYVVVLIPIVLCIILLVMVNKQQQSLRDANEEIGRLSQNQTELVQKLGELNAATGDITLDIKDIDSSIQTIKDELHEKDVFARSSSGKWPTKVYLTFDDGPSANTGKILEILDKYGVKGNFFVVGTESDNMKKYYKRIVDEGHVIGMHSYSHKYSEIYVSKEAFVDDLNRISNLIYEQTGVRPSIYRFPGGSSNNVSKVPMSELIKILDERGIVYYDWNVLSGDATNPALPAEDIINNSLASIGDYKEAMILFHDLSNKTTTVEALPQIIEALLEQGITITTIDDTTMLIQHNNNN